MNGANDVVEFLVIIIIIIIVVLLRRNNKKAARAIAGRTARCRCTYQILRAVSLRQHGFLVVGL